MCPLIKLLTRRLGDNNFRSELICKIPQASFVNEKKPRLPNLTPGQPLNKTLEFNKEYFPGPDRKKKARQGEGYLEGPGLPPLPSLPADGPCTRRVDREEGNKGEMVSGVAGCSGMGD